MIKNLLLFVILKLFIPLTLNNVIIDSTTDNQCRIIYQTYNASFCQESNRTICSAISCKKSKNSNCIFSSFGAEDGTICGKNKICMNGFCILADCRYNPCLNDGICYMKQGNIKCKCKLGFFGKICSKKIPDYYNKNPCLFNRCGKYGKCFQTTLPGSGYYCICNNGIGSFGTYCRDYNGCGSELETCQNNGTCVHSNSFFLGFYCNCTSNYTGKYCEIELKPNMTTTTTQITTKKNLCQPNPCFNGGSCIIFSSTYYLCICPNGYKGKKCENIFINQDFCKPNPCLNNGTCNKYDYSPYYWCLCLNNYYGTNCEKSWIFPSTTTDIITTPQSSCFPNPCLNNGKCVDLGSLAKLYWCSCQEWYYGKNCQYKLPIVAICQNCKNDCQPNPCLNSGTCVNQYRKNFDKNYWCICSNKYYGVNCELSY